MFHIQVYAVAGKSTQAVDFLVAHGASVNSTANDGTTPICVAAQEGHVGEWRALQLTNVVLVTHMRISCMSSLKGRLLERARVIGR